MIAGFQDTGVVNACAEYPHSVKALAFNDHCSEPEPEPEPELEPHDKF